MKPNAAFIAILLLGFTASAALAQWQYDGPPASASPYGDDPESLDATLYATPPEPRGIILRPPPYVPPAGATDSTTMRAAFFKEYRESLLESVGLRKVPLERPPPDPDGRSLAERVREAFSEEGPATVREAPMPQRVTPPRHRADRRPALPAEPDPPAVSGVEPATPGPGAADVERIHALRDRLRRILEAGR